MTNFSQLPLDTRRIIVAYFKGDVPKKTAQQLISEHERWDDLYGVVCHTILNGPGGACVHNETLVWIDKRKGETWLEAKQLRMLPLIEKLLLKCKIASV